MFSLRKAFSFSLLLFLLGQTSYCCKVLASSLDAAADAQSAYELHLTSQEQNQLGQWLLWYGSGQTGSEPQLPEAIVKDKRMRYVFISAGDGKRSASIYNGRGIGIAAAFRDALSYFPGSTSVPYLKVDLIQGLDKIGQSGTNSKINIGFEGIAVGMPPQVFYLPEQVRFNLADQGREKAEFLQLMRENKERLYRFTCYSYFLEKNQWHLLYRGHRTFNQINVETLKLSMDLASRYLVQAVDNSGRFHYLYDPVGNYDISEYNILRHAGTLYAMMELYEKFREEEVLNSARRALDYLLSQTRVCSVNGKQHSCVVEDGKVKLGGNALAVLAITKFIQATGEKEILPQAVSLAGWMKATQTANGYFEVHIQTYPEHQVSSFRSSYYDGEALFALLRLYAVDPDPQWLAAAEKGIDYALHKQKAEENISQIEHDHWLLYALNEIYDYKKKADYVDAGLKIALSIVLSQTESSQIADHIGSFQSRPLSTPTATRSEALGSAYRLAVKAGKTQEADLIRTVLLSAVRFGLQTQIFPETALYFPAPEKALGGFLTAYDQPAIRIDGVQHNVSGILSLYDLMTKDKMSHS